jgi:RimJ/RimL family protein N-acetyltransferase
MNLMRTHDMALVASIMRSPAIWPHVHDDGTPDDWAPTDADSFHWMLVTLDSGEVGGVFLLHALNSHCFEMHTCLLPHAWGEQAAAAAQMLAGHVFHELGGEKLVTNVPVYNRAARRFAIAGGMQHEGINRASFMKGGRMIDQVFLGITKQEWLCQQQ